MLGVVFGDELFACQLERFLPGFRPGRPVRNRLREHQQTLRIRQQAVYPSLTGRGGEPVRVFDVRPVNQKLTYAVLGQGIETQNLDLSPYRYAFQVHPVMGSEPVGLSAGQAESGAPELVELGANGVKRRAAICICRSGPHFVEPVDEQRHSMPLGPVDERDEIACGDVLAPAVFSLPFERHRLPGAGGAEQHIGIALAEIF